ncbi:two-component system response regulator YesN [Evansella vedderi]|uniref:Two-component system response regulator YesN n=1 Tax=Evansella vedderi TaxID=38282 RepID=A0ABT9ZZJ2_9BACI|nr:response regulator [Evansella vedderi]MDQ0256656.1 two-component system response regulator YesN [Evansella vedderi]
MKAMIIDDEQHVRDGLKLLGDWEKYGITSLYEAADGQEAMQLIREYEPEIIFTDMRMPRCDGIDLLKWIHNSEIHAKTIVVSGYDDFKYTKNAITYGSFDYLLKPINPVELNETLERVVAKWKEENRERVNQVETDQLIWDHLLSDVLHEQTLPPRVMEQIRAAFSPDISFNEYTIAIIPVKKAIGKKIAGDGGKGFSSLLTMLNKTLSHWNCGVAFRNITNEDEMVILFWKNMKEMLPELHCKLKKTTGLHCIFVCGNPSDSLQEAYQSARRCLNRKNLLCTESEGFQLEEVINEGRHSVELVHLFDYSEEIKWAIQSNSVKNVDEILESIFKVFREKQWFSMEQLELWESQFEILKEHWLKEYNIPRNSPLWKTGSYWDEQGNFSLTDFFQEKTKEFHELFESVVNGQYQKEKNSVQMIEEYIRANYQKDIKLQDIADQFFLSREYISRKFKQEYNETITDYLTRIRVEKAKELLKNPYLKVYEIASVVGYQNDKYFIKVFKKVEGVTPAELRSGVAK